MSDNTNTETADTTGWWIPLLAVVGMAAGGLSYATNTAALGLVGAVLLLIAAGAGMGQGWLVGLGPKQRGEAEDPIAEPETVRTVTVASMETGVGQIDVGLDSAGEITAARWSADEPWGPTRRS
ncbi:MAG: hypothetical protein KDB70_04190 [Mycobacterium sp.]|nr:hypothetical protein [Mycobacterium sp.]